jgi:hypothetical protein
MKVKKIRKIIDNGDGNITVVHSDGTFHYNEQDVTLKEWTNNFFCRFNIDEQSNWQRFIFWNWVLSFSIGIFFILVGMKFIGIPLESKQDGFLDLIRVFLAYLLYLIPFSLLSYSIFRIIYFYRYRDFFSKNFIHISLKNNQSITLKGDSNQLVQVIQKILPRDENQRNFEKESKNDTETKLISEYIFAIIIFSISFYSIYSNWGENSITDPNPTLSSYYQEELSKKELSKLTKTQKIDYRQKRLNDINEYIEIKAKWDKKYENEDISSFYFFSLGYVLPLIIGVVIFVCLSLFLLCIFFGAYLVFWPLGYSFNRLQSRRDLYKILENKFIYPIVAIIFIISIVTNQLLTKDILSTLVLFLIPIAAPFIFALFISIATTPPNGLIRDFFTKNYWKFLFTGRNVFTSEHSFLNLILMITIPWLILFYHGFNDGSPETIIQEVILVICLFIVSLRLLFRALSPIGLEFLSVRPINIQNKRYLNLYKNDFLSIQTLVKTNGWKLGFASERLKDNDIIVETAVQNFGLSLQFASAELRNDKNIVLKAIKQNPKAIEFASIEMQNDPDIIEQLKKGD